MSAKSGGHTRAVAVVAGLVLGAVLSAPADAAIVTFPVVVSADDAIETTAPVTTLNGVTLTVRSNAIAANIRHTGLRFPSVTVARGSVVNRATLEIYCPDASGSFDDFSAAVYGHASDNSPVFAAGVNGVNVRTKTAAFQTIYRPNWGGPGWRYIDVTAIVQEIVDRSGWVSGNALSILLIGGGAFPAGEFQIEAWDNAGTNHPRLTIDSGATGNVYLREHASGQPADQFGTFPVYTGIPLYRFRLQNTTAGAVSITSLRLRAPSVRGIASADLTSLRINDGTSDVATGGVPAMGRATGTITFTPGAWTIPASSTVDYTVYGDVGALAGYDTLFLSLAAADVAASTTVSGGALSRARHVEDTTLGAGPKMVYSDKVANCLAAADLFDSTYSSTWSPAPGAAAVTDPPYEGWWKLLRVKPDFSQMAVVARDCGGSGRPTIRASFWNGSNWDYPGGGLQDSFDVSAYLYAGSDSGTNRSYDAAYESVSGRLLVANGVNTVNNIVYSVWDGSSWVINNAAAGSMGVNTGYFTWVKLAPIPGTNKIAMVALSSTNEVTVATWNGDTNSWVDKTGGGLSGVVNAGLGADIAVVRGGPNAGEVVAVWSTTTPVLGLRHKVYHTNAPTPAWDGSPTNGPTLAAGNQPNWLRLRADDSGKVIAGVETVNEEIRTAVFDGAARTWGAFSAAHSTTAYGNADNNRAFDLVYDRASTAGGVILAYSDTAGIKYRTSSDSGASWSAEQTLDNARTAYWVQMEAEPSRLVHLAINDANDDLQAWTWDGAAWKFETPTPISSDLEVNTQTALHDVEPFALTSFPSDGGVKINYRSIGTAANYTTGTLSTTSGSATVTGVGTAWKTSNRGRGDRITIGANSYVILRVDTDTQLTLASPAVATVAGSAYTIARQFTTLQAWEDCISFAVACTYFPVASADLVDDNRREIGIAYKDSSFGYTPGSPTLQFDGTTTDPTHTITLTADGVNRHYGISGAGVVVDDTGNSAYAALSVLDDHVTVEWLEIVGGTGKGIDVGGQLASDNLVVLRNLIVHGTGTEAINLEWNKLSAVVSNNFVYATGGDGVRHVPNPGMTAGAYVYLLNNTVRGAALSGFTSTLGGTALLARNNVSTANAGSAFALNTISPASSNNYASDTTGISSSPAGGGRDSVPDSGGGGFNFVNTATGNLHLQATSVAVNGGAGLGSLMDAIDVDAQVRSGTWDVGADEFGATTAVTLMSFQAAAGDGEVTLLWQTASELDNLGFHLHRATSAAGPWERITPRLIAGLGSSPIGRAYSWVDRGLANGVPYFYRLEDVDTHSVSTFHGPVSAVPGTPAPPPAEGGGSGGSGTGGGSPSTGVCPSWVLAAASSSSPASCTVHGQPEEVSYVVRSRDARGAVVELRTGGFYAVRDAAGSVRAFVPGFDQPQDPLAPALPVKRALVEAEVGRRARIASVEAFDLRGFPRLRPSTLGQPDLVLPGDGTVLPARRAKALPPVSRGYLPRDQARLAGTVFQGEEKSAVLELVPVRYDAYRGQLVLARRLVVRLAFTGREDAETGAGHVGRRAPRERTLFRDVLAELHTSRRGLHAVGFEQLFPSRQRGIPASQLRLQRQGLVVPFRVEPASLVFGPGSTLYFFADVTPASTAFASEVAWQLVRSTDGLPMASVAATPAGAAATGATGRASFERNRFYQPGLLDAPDPWLWEAAGNGVSRSVPFALEGADPSGPTAHLAVALQGGSDAEVTGDHHVGVLVNGVPAGQATFDGKRPFLFDATVPASALRDGANELTLVNAGDTGVQSLVFLDRFSLEYPRRPVASAGAFEGVWQAAGAAEVAVPGPAVVVDATPGSIAWLSGFEQTASSVRFAAAAGHRYVVVAREGILAPRVNVPAPSSLKSGDNQADFLVIAPESFLEAAQPLVERREGQGLATRAVSLEEIASTFGGGEPSAEAVRTFLSHAYHSWARPSPRYVLLLGDSTDDPRNFTGTAGPAPLPALRLRTTYLWTASDPALAAVNGEDTLPDLAIGRLPAATPEEAARLVAKVLDWEDAGNDLSGEAVLVADNPDAGGDFEANARELASGPLAGRPTETLLVRQLGAGTRPAILDAFGRGASLVSYVGHGGAAVWASENVLNSWDAPSLPEQSRQPVLLTLNCLNGYFVAPNFDALTEALLKADGRGIVAGVSPSGLSLDAPAHAYHRALAASLVSGAHDRLGDAILAAQRDYAAGGTMPELLGVYHLFGDPTMRIRP